MWEVSRCNSWPQARQSPVALLDSSCAAPERPKPPPCESSAFLLYPHSWSSVVIHRLLQDTNSGSPIQYQDCSLSQEAGAHACNPSYSGGRDQEDQGSKPARTNSSQVPISKKTITKKGWWSTQGEFKPQYGKNKIINKYSMGLEVWFKW
jgi:hypothetical protein